MAVEGWITLAVVTALVVALVREFVQPALAVLGATVFLMLIGVITPQEAFAGFSNEAPIAVGALLIFARAVGLSGVMQPVVSTLFGRAGGRVLLARLVYPIAGLSAFMNNTTLVAMSVPAVLDLSQRRRLPPSRFLMPVSYAAILGGVITTVGTSTNLTVSGLLREAGMEPLSLFELTPIGLPIAAVGCLIIALFAGRLLPDRHASSPDLDELRHFAVTMRVVPRGPADRRTVDQAGLRHLSGVFLVEIDRGGRRIAPVAPDEVLEGGDVLSFVGRVDDVVDLQRTAGLESTEGRQIAQLGGGSHEFYEVVISNSLGLVGRTMREIGFRARYGAAVIAVHRAGHRLGGKLGDVRLRMGDTLLVLADAGFYDRFRDHPDFLVVAPRHGVSPTQPRKAGIVLAIGIGFILLVGTGLVPILQGAVLAAGLVLLTGVITLRQARDAVDLGIVVLIAAAFGLGTAIETSGLGEAIAGLVVDAAAPLGPIGGVLAMLLATMLLTELVSNNAAAVLMFPIAVATAAGLGMDPRPLVITVALGASLSFLTPIGYQTNLMVFGLGQYRFADYFRLGLPLNLAVIAVVLVVLPLAIPL
jgi:di/tricarboxylate transporter